MTSPIERAAEALQGQLLAGQRELNPGQALDAARIAYDAIDTNQLAGVIFMATPFRSDDARHIAELVKNWLTGNN